jgi:hypothetical protein
MDEEAFAVTTGEDEVAAILVPRNGWQRDRFDLLLRLPLRCQFAATQPYSLCGALDGNFIKHSAKLMAELRNIDRQTVVTANGKQAVQASIGDVWH